MVIFVSFLPCYSYLELIALIFFALLLLENDRHVSEVVVICNSFVKEIKPRSVYFKTIAHHSVSLNLLNG